MRVPKQSESVFRRKSTAAVYAQQGLDPADCKCGTAGLVADGGRCCMAGNVCVCNNTSMQCTSEECDVSFADRAVY